MTPEQSAAIERLKQALARHEESTDKWKRAACHQAAMMLCTPDTIRTILAALDEAQQDAARYRVLRSGEHLQFSLLVALTEPAPVVSAAQGWEEIEGEDMDAAIDAARAGGAA